MSLAFLFAFLATGLSPNLANAKEKDGLVTISAKAKTLKSVLESIEKQTGYEFFHNSTVINTKTVVSLDLKNAPLEQVLDTILTPRNLSYKIKGDRIVITPKSKAPQQDKKVKISGKVLDSDGEEIPGANIRVRGNADLGTITDFEGNFTLMAPMGSVLEFSYVGFSNEEMQVDGPMSDLKVSLTEDVTELGEVVVTALGIKREKKALGYAVTEVKSSEITNTGETNVVNGLQGKVAGLSIGNTSAGSNGSQSVVLRGNSSIAGNNQALIVVDGVIYDSGDFGQGNSAEGFDRGSGISDINPEDIESVTVLKGANAAALYGAKAATGVLVITTKKRLRDKGIGLSYKGGVTLNDAYVFPDLQNVYGQGKAGSSKVGFYDGVAEDGIPVIGGGTKDESWGPKMEGQDVHVAWLRGNPIRKYSPQEDNYKDIFRTGVRVDHNVSMSYGSDKATYYLSFLNQESSEYVPNSEWSKTGVSLRVTQDVTDRFSIDGKLNFVEQSARNRMSTGYGPSAYTQLAKGPRSFYDSDLRNYKYGPSGKDWGNKYFADGEQVIWSTTSYIGNPYWALYQNSNSDKRRRLVGSFKLNYKIFESLNASLRHSFDQTDFENHAAFSEGSRWGAQEGRYEFKEGYRKTSTTDLLISGQKDLLGGDFTIGGTAGASQYRRSSHTSSFVGRGFKMSDLNTINNTKEQATTYGDSDEVVNSIFASLQLSYQNIYFLEATGRSDWSSTLSEENRRFDYPSVTGSIVFSEFIEDQSILSFGKFRASWAEVGNGTQAGVINQSYNLIQSPNGEILVTNDDVLAFEGLLPERMTSLEIGADLRFFNGLATLDATYYNAVTKNQILPRKQISTVSGYRYRVVNGGEVRNRGIELMLGLNPITTDNFSWRINAAYNKAKSEVLDLDGQDSFVLGGGKYAHTALVEGEPFPIIRGVSFKRDDDGNVMVDSKGIPMRSDDPNVHLGKVEPDWTGSLTNTVSYKGLTLSAQIDVSMGGNIISNTNVSYDEQGNSVASLNGRQEWIESEEARRAAGSPSDWVPTGGVDLWVGNSVFEDGTANSGDNAYYANPYKFWDGMRKIGEHVIEDASYVKFRQLSLTYRLPKRLVEKTPFQSIDFSVVGRNLWILYRETEHYDPELYRSTTATNTYGIEKGYWPASRSFNFNVKVRL
ncbi:SusC/RagA family TonB-linked outer membrane protein [Fulvitalea axinellae]